MSLECVMKTIFWDELPVGMMFVSNTQRAMFTL